MVMGPVPLGPERDCTANYRPVLSSERVSHFNNLATVRKLAYPPELYTANCRTKEKRMNLLMGIKGVPSTKIDWPTDRR
jgi:hypothetical protein